MDGTNILIDPTMLTFDMWMMILYLSEYKASTCLQWYPRPAMSSNEDHCAVAEFTRLLWVTLSFNEWISAPWVAVTGPTFTSLHSHLQVDRSSIQISTQSLAAV